MSKNSKAALLAAGAAILLLAPLSYWGFCKYQSHARLMEAIKIATGNPHGLDPGALVDKIDASYASLPPEEKRKIAADPKLLSERIENASYNNYKQAFGELFMLPAPIRRKVIESSAAAIADAMEKDKDRVDAFYDSDAGKAALLAASKYFLSELDGKQKAELKPLTDAFFKIHKDRAQRGKY